MLQKITPMLWFNNEAEEAANYYVSLFKNSRVGTIARYPEGAPGSPGSVMVVDFELEGQRFSALNGGPQFKFNESVSFVVHCDSQEEVDYFWSKLTANGGEESMCGWLKDKYGLSWQVVPRALIEMISDPDKAKSQRAFNAMLQMKKIDIAELKKAFAGV